MADVSEVQAMRNWATRVFAGDVCGEQSFLPKETPLEQGKPLTFAPV